MALTFKQWLDTNEDFYEPEGWIVAIRADDGISINVWEDEQQKVRKEWFIGLRIRFKEAGYRRNTLVINNLPDVFKKSDLKTRWR